MYLATKRIEGGGRKIVLKKVRSYLNKPQGICCNVEKTVKNVNDIVLDTLTHTSTSKAHQQD